MTISNYTMHTKSKRLLPFGLSSAEFVFICSASRSLVQGAEVGDEGVECVQTLRVQGLGD